ncbi:HD domain-containing protein [Crossiella sp. CA-258035]|uniref:HD domain-containing protein n=1 Tax=Crossiella sp. CA-258035 TaxID=2981138 RepID=UPI0024BCF071|nr:HD domain-containing protein [Crossiella sp. CA-258035]WHT22583.1 HD domain-containing protein [Crossiella sp. CA-258035]
MGIARGMGITGEHARRLVALWAGLHDLGKITEVFQRLNQAAFAELERLAGYPVDGSIPRVRHDLAGQIAVAPLLAAPTGLARPLLGVLSMLDAHGVPATLLTTPAVLAHLGKARGRAVAASR